MVSTMLDTSGCERRYAETCEKYGIPPPQPEPPPDPRVVRRRWRVFLAVEGLLCLGVIASATLCGSWDVFLSLVCVLILLSPLLALLMVCINVPLSQWLDLGLISSRTARAMRRDVRQRAALRDEEFYSRFFEGSEIPRETVTRVRKILIDRIESLADRLHSTGYLPVLWEDLDFSDIFFVLSREFGVPVGKKGMFDGTLEGTIRLVHLAIEQRAGGMASAR